MDEIAVAGQAPSRNSGLRRRGVVATGSVATVAAMAAVTLAAALAEAGGVDFELPEGGRAIPLPGFAVVTGGLSLVGVVLAVALRRWTSRPVTMFLPTVLSLTAISLIAPLASGASGGTVIALLALHLLAAAIVIPPVTRALRCALPRPTTARAVCDA